MADGQRAELIRDLARHAHDAADHVAFISRTFRELMESDERAMSADDAVAAGNALEGAAREMPELTRVFSKQVRLLGGPPPRLAIRSTEEPGHLGIIARYPSGDLDVGDAQRTGSGDSAGWRIRLTGNGQARSSIGLCWDALVDEVLDAATRRLNEYGPWWAPGEEARADG